MSEARGKFVISLDCEGKWGMADSIGPMHNKYITHSGLVHAYEKLCRLFEWHDVSATFAFVMGFILDDEGRREFRHYFQDTNIEGKNWLRHFRSSEASGNLDGWFCPEALSIVRRYGRHEVAAHGFTHLPLAETTTSRDAADREVTACVDVAVRSGFKLDTFIYPRNQVGHIDVLKKAGFKGYREFPRRVPFVPGKFSNLLMEANVRCKAEDMLPNHASGVSRVPGGAMINWQHGARKAIPPFVSAFRWSSILADAATNGKVAHLWLHPHNILTAPTTYDLLDRILREVNYWRSENMLDVVTQAQIIGAEPPTRSNDIFGSLVIKP